MSSQTLTQAEFQAALETAARTGAEAAVRSINTVDPMSRPAAPTAVGSPIHHNRGDLPRLSKVINALREGSWRGAELERDFCEATRSRLLPEAEPRSAVLPTSASAYVRVIEEADLPAAKTPAFRAFSEAVRAMGETTGSAGGFLVPTQYLQDQFLLSLQSAVAFRNAPGVDVLPVASNVIALPRETVMPTAAAYAEAAPLTAADATFAQQNITIKKQAAYSLFSNELLADATPEFEAYIAKTLARSLALFQDLQQLEGSGTGNNVVGMASYPGLTAGYTPAANGDSYSATGAADKLIDLIFGLRNVGVEPNAWIMHPRTLQSLSKLKDTQNRYVLQEVGGSFGAPLAIPGAGSLATQVNAQPSAWRGMLLGIPVLVSSQIPINEVQGTASNATHLYVGDFNFAKILERQAIELALSPHVAFNTDQTAVRVSGRMAPVLLAPAAFTKQGGIIP